MPFIYFGGGGVGKKSMSVAFGGGVHHCLSERNLIFFRRAVSSPSGSMANFRFRVKFKQTEVSPAFTSFLKSATF